MSHSSKIACACALVLAAALAAWVWPEDDYNDAVHIELADVAASDPSVVSFTITNRSKTRFALKLGTLTFPSNGHWEELDLTLANPHALPDRSFVSCSDRVSPQERSHRWRLAVGYTVAVVDSPIHRARWHLREYAHSLGWKRAGAWILPGDKWRYAYGPEMVGNEPAPLAK